MISVKFESYLQFSTYSEGEDITNKVYNVVAFYVQSKTTVGSSTAFGKAKTKKRVKSLTRRIVSLFRWFKLTNSQFLDII